MIDVIGGAADFYELKIGRSPAIQPQQLHRYSKARGSALHFLSSLYLYRIATLVTHLCLAAMDAVLQPYLEELKRYSGAVRVPGLGVA